MTNETKILNDYIKYKKLSVHSEKIRDIEFYVAKLLNFKKKDFNHFTESDLVDFFNSLGNYTTWTQNFIKWTIKNFLKWCFVDWSSRFRNLDKVCRTETPESAYKPEDMLSVSDFEKLVSAEKDIFWKAFFVTLFYGCCRPSEICILKWINIEFEKDGGAFFTIFSKKNKKSFIKYLPKEAAHYLKQMQSNKSEYVFINPLTELPITRRGAYWHIRKLSKEVLGKEIDLYTLRHSIATINYNKDNIKDDIIARQMGHTKSMKGVYTHNDREKLKADAKKIYVGDLPPEKKHELELKIEKQQEQIDHLSKALWQMFGKHKNELRKLQIFPPED